MSLFNRHAVEDKEVADNPMLKAIDVRMRRALKPAKVVIALLITLIIGLGFVAGQLEYYHFTHPTANAIVNNSIQNCDSNNGYRTGQTQIWQAYLALQAKESTDTATELTALIAVLSDNNPAKIATIRSILVSSAKTDKTDQDAFMTKVMSVNAPRNCVAANQVTGG